MLAILGIQHNLENKLNNVSNLKNTTEWVIGRNDPCPCGSGKKFKICCARR